MASTPVPPPLIVVNPIDTGTNDSSEPPPPMPSESSSPLSPASKLAPLLPPLVQNSAPSSTAASHAPPAMPPAESSPQVLSYRVLPPSPPTQSSIPSLVSQVPPLSPPAQSFVVSSLSSEVPPVLSPAESSAALSSQVLPPSSPLAQSSIPTASSSSLPPAIPPVESSSLSSSSQVPPTMLMVESSASLPSSLPSLPPALQSSASSPSTSFVEPLASSSSSTPLSPPPPEHVQSFAPLPSSLQHATQLVQSLGPSSASLLPPHSSPRTDSTTTEQSSKFQKQFGLFDLNEKPQPSSPLGSQDQTPLVQTSEQTAVALSPSQLIYNYIPSPSPPQSSPTDRSAQRSELAPFTSSSCSSIKIFNKIIYPAPPQAQHLQLLPPPEPSTSRLTLSNFKPTDNIKPAVIKPVPLYPSPSSSRAQNPQRGNCLSWIDPVKNLKPLPQAPPRKPSSFGSSPARLGKPSWMSRPCWANFMKKEVNYSSVQQPLIPMPVPPPPLQTIITPSATSSRNNQTESSGGTGGPKKRSSPDENAEGRDMKCPIIINDDDEDGNIPSPTLSCMSQTRPATSSGTTQRALAEAFPITTVPDDKQEKKRKFDEISSHVMIRPKPPPFPNDLHRLIARSKQRALQLEEELLRFELGARGQPPKSKPSGTQCESSTQAHTDRTTEQPAVSFQKHNNVSLASFIAGLTHTPPPSSNETQTEPRSEIVTSKEYVLPRIPGQSKFPSVPLTEVRPRKYNDIKSAICYDSFSSDDLYWMPPNWWVEERISLLSGLVDTFYHDDTGLVFHTKAGAMRHIKEMGLEPGPGTKLVGRRHKITRFS